MTKDNGWEGCLDLDDVAETSPKAKSELAALRKESERLDFLIRNFVRLGSLDMSGEHFYTGIGRTIGRGRSARDAIDKAITDANQENI